MHRGRIIATRDLLPVLEHHEGEFRAGRRHLVRYTGRNFEVIAGMHGDGGAADNLTAARLSLLGLPD